MISGTFALLHLKINVKPIKSHFKHLLNSVLIKVVQGFYGKIDGYQ